VYGNTKASFLQNQNKWQCSSHRAKRHFTVKIGTIFEYGTEIALGERHTAEWDDPRVAEISQ
jgi:hypothetical protein